MKVPRLALMSSRQLAENGDIHCWYAEMQQWFETHGMSINALPPFQYSLDSPHLMEYEDQRCLGLFLLELKRHREKLLKDNNTATQAHS